MKYLKRIKVFVFFILFYGKEMIMANLRVAYDILTVKQYYHDGVVRIYIGPLNSIQLAMLMNLITMTPGTICLDYNEDTKNLIIHLMFMDEADKVANKIREKYLPLILGG